MSQASLIGQRGKFAPDYLFSVSVIPDVLTSEPDEIWINVPSKITEVGREPHSPGNYLEYRSKRSGLEQFVGEN